MKPTVSVLVASYNFGRYIAAALESVRLQTFGDFEAIVVDDGSTDESLAIIGQFLDDDRFRLVRQRHGGQARAKNRGIEEARGRYIAFLDADDYWLPHKLERQLGYFTDSSIGVVFSRRVLIDGDGRPMMVSDDPLPSGAVVDEMFRQNFICFSSAMVRAQVVDHVGRFDERLDLAIDYDFWLRVARHYSFACVDEPLAAYRVGHANLSRRQLERLNIARFIMKRFRRRYGGDAVLDPRAIDRAECETLTHLSVISRGYSRLAAIGWALRAIRINPLSGPAWWNLIAAMAPEFVRRIVRRLRGRDGAWNGTATLPPTDRSRFSNSQTMLTNRRLLTNAVVNTLGFIAQIAVSFVMAPITIAALGDVRYGLWSFVESFLAFMLLFDLGVAASLVRFVPRFVTSGDRDNLNRTYSACLIFFVTAAACAALVGWFGLSTAANRWIAIPAELAPEMRLVALVVVLHFALSLPLSVYPAMLDGLHAFVAKSVTRTIFLLARIPVLLLVFRTAAPLLNMVLVLAAANLVESLLLAWLVYRRLPGLRFVPRQVDRETIRAVRGYSVDAFVAMLAGRLAFSTDAFVIGRLLSVPAIGYFAIANRVVDLAKTVLRSATTTLTPAVSASEARGDLDAVRVFVIHGTRLSLYLVLPIQIGLFVFGRQFLTLWIGPEYATAATPSLWILNVTLALTIAQSVASRVLYGMGRIRTFARVTLLEGVVNVVLSAALVGPLGIAGAAWGTTIPHIACCAFVIGHVGRLLGLSTKRYIRTVWLMPLVAAIVPLAVWLPLNARVTIWTWPTLVGCGCLGLAPYAVLVAAIEWRGRVRARRARENYNERRAA